jgi:hypothetical protein
MKEIRNSERHTKTGMLSPYVIQCYLLPFPTTVLAASLLWKTGEPTVQVLALMDVTQQKRQSS